MRIWMKCTMFALLSSAALCTEALADEAYTKAGEYLSEYCNVEPFSAEDGDLDAVNAALTALGGEALKTETVDHEAVIAEGIRLAGLEELAQSYENDANPTKADDVLERKGITVENEEYAPYIACALDLGLIDTDMQGKEDAEEFLYRCLETCGKGRHYIGRISDENILSELRSTLVGFDLFDNEILSDLGEKIVLNGAATGYSLKYSPYDAHFLDDYTIRYGHSDYQHAVQLVGLLKSEGMDGYIQLEPKVSVYEYLLEWGDPGEATPTYEVKEVEEGRYLCYAMEYDMAIEFDSREEKEAFHSLIENYAKKYDDRVDEDGNVTAKLLAESWWAPLYYSLPPLEDEEYGELVDNTIYDSTGMYSIHSFTLPEMAEGIAEMVEEEASGLEVNEATVYVNPAFMRYTTGEDHQ